MGLDVLERVHARCHPSGEEGTEDGADLAVPAGVLDHLQLEVGDSAVATATDLDGLELGAPVSEVHHRLTPRLAETDRATDRAGKRANE